MSPTPWKTAITDTSEGRLVVRGVEISDAIEYLSFGAMVYLLWKGQPPSAGAARVMDAILVSSVDHGTTAPSPLAARVVMSGGNPLNAAVAAGVLAIGDSHGGAIEACAKLYQAWLMTSDEIPDVARLAPLIVEEFQQKQIRVPGYGHRVYQRDPRTLKLIEIAEREKLRGRAVDLALAIQDELEKRSGGKPLPLNVDGAIAALMSDLGFDWKLGKGFFILSRTAGLIAQANEERSREKPMRSFGQSAPEYDGPRDVKLD
ncbi:citryl-CoA lyase [bacterium]|nr:citryl-CoA lyase [bacterium]MBU1985099.1 citryl-CoA lyase [bacterium]